MGMTLALIILGGISLAELPLYWLPASFARKSLAVIIGVFLAAATFGLVAVTPTIWAGVVAVLTVYRLLNLVRLVKGRVHERHLVRTARRTAFSLVGLQVITVCATLICLQFDETITGWLYVLAICQLAGAGIITLSTLRSLHKTTPVGNLPAFADRDLPSLTVAIPARNETQDLQECLESLVQSNYPKLEIIVLDDCSQDKRTPEIIRQFAHDGVRFMAGEVPPEKWLAKNYAYQQLAEDANGEIILFCGVDTRFTPTTLSNLVKTMLSRKKTMLSVIPRNQLPNRWSLEGLMVQPSRYAWELSLPRRLVSRPPILSTCWLVRKDVLKAAGGFKAFARSCAPESHIARSVIKSDGYNFIQSNQAIGLASAKRFSDQQATAVRTRYPQLHRRPEQVALVSFIEFAVLVAPFALLLSSLITESWGIAAISAFTVFLLTYQYSLVVTLTYRKVLARSLWLLPFAALYDIGLVHYSMWMYEFREVIWKGRNVCLPVMQVIPSLPKS
jgi:chlorobactene glucosyltransferase